MLEETLNSNYFAFVSHHLPYKFPGLITAQ